MAFRAVFSAVQVAQMTDVASGLKMENSMIKQINGGNFHQDNPMEICRDYTVLPGFQRFWTLCKDLTNIDRANKFSEELRNKKKGKGFKAKKSTAKKANKSNPVSKAHKKNNKQNKPAPEKLEAAISAQTSMQKKMKKFKNNVLKNGKELLKKLEKLDDDLWFKKIFVEKLGEILAIEDEGKKFAALLSYFIDFHKFFTAFVSTHVTHADMQRGILTHVSAVDIKSQNLWEKSVGFDFSDDINVAKLYKKDSTALVDFFHEGEEALEQLEKLTADCAVEIVVAFEIILSKLVEWTHSCVLRNGEACDWCQKQKILHGEKPKRKRSLLVNRQTMAQLEAQFNVRMLEFDSDASEFDF